MTDQCSLAVQAPFTPLLVLLHQLLQDQGHTDSEPPFLQLPDAEANVGVLQAAGFTNVQVSLHSFWHPPAVLLGALFGASQTCGCSLGELACTYAAMVL